LKQVAPDGAITSRAQNRDAAAGGGAGVGGTRARDRAQANESRATSLDATRRLIGFVAAAGGARVAERFGNRLQDFSVLDSARTTMHADKARVGAGTGVASRGIDAARDAGRQITARVEAARRQASIKAIERAASIGATAQKIENLGTDGSSNRGGYQNETTLEGVRAKEDWSRMISGANRALDRAHSLESVSNNLAQAAGAGGPGGASSRRLGGRDGSALAAMAPAVNGRVRAAAARSSAVAARARLGSPKFADPPARGFERDSRSGAVAVTINSSPTVVVNSGEGRGDVEREVISALRAHREELFDSMRREAARRERAQF
jgi:hypothetical protein